MEDKTMFDVKEILKKVNEEGYGVVAIRHCAEDEEYNVGDICRNSFDWNYELDHSTYEDEEQVELNGTCGIHVIGFENLDEEEIEEATELFNKAMEKANVYSGQVVVIVGDSYDYGSDEDEVIIRDAEVIAIA